MDRRAFFTMVGGGILAAPLGATAQQPERIVRIGLLAGVPFADPEAARMWAGFVQGLRDLGYMEGQNVTIERRAADAKYEQLSALGADLVRLKVDVIVVGPTPRLAAKQATRTIPIVLLAAPDPVRQGLVASLARPGGNVTGVSGFAPELSGKRLELIREVLPQADRVAVLANRANPVTVPILRATESAAQQLRMKLQVVDVRQPAQLGAAFEAVRCERADALTLVADPLLFSERPQIIQLAARHRIPTIYEFRLFADAGGLLSYGPLAQERFARMTIYVDRILRGAQPGDLPVEQPTKFELVINLKTAKALGLTIPQSLLVRADEIIR